MADAATMASSKRTKVFIVAVAVAVVGDMIVAILPRFHRSNLLVPISALTARRPSSRRTFTRRIYATIAGTSLCVLI